jgi:CBS domain-containing protein
MHIGAILQNKGTTVHSIQPHSTLVELVDLMLSLRVSSLIVLTGGGQLAGIVTERDLVRTLQKSPSTWMTARVEEVMTRDLFVASPDDQLDKIITEMTARHIRHVPVLDGTRVAGVLSMRDLVAAAMSELARHNLMLKRYIEDWPKEG